MFPTFHHFPLCNHEYSFFVLFVNSTSFTLINNASSFQNWINSAVYNALIRLNLKSSRIDGLDDHFLKLKFMLFFSLLLISFQSTTISSSLLIFFWMSIVTNVEFVVLQKIYMVLLTICLYSSFHLVFRQVQLKSLAMLLSSAHILLTVEYGIR